MNKQEFITRLFEIGAVRFGSFTLKSGIVSPFYINLRQIISYPDMLAGAARLLSQLLPPEYEYKRLAGVPYAGIPVSAALSLHINKPIIIPRKEEKAYGSKDLVIGEFSEGDTCLLIEDLITSGESILETRTQLEQLGLKVTGACVLIDRRAIKRDFYHDHGMRLFALISIEEIVTTLLEKGLISDAQAKEIQMFLMNTSLGGVNDENQILVNTATERLRTVMREKKSNVILSLDVDNTTDFFNILDATAESIVMVKTHVDILKDFSWSFVERLAETAKKYNVLLFEDRKFADIGNTVRMQYRSGIYRIADWAQFVTVHMIAGEAILKGLFEGLSGRSSFLLAKMSAKDNLITENYTRKVLEIGRKHQGVVSGFIGHGGSEQEIRMLKNKIPHGMLLLMPGVQLASKGDSLGQTYISPETAVNGGADAVIVGRGITHAPDAGAAAREYKQRAAIN